MSGNNSNNSNAGDDADMWDDTALIQGWDDAVAEYQRYHSIYHHEGGPAPTVSAASTTASQASQANRPATTSNPQSLAHDSANPPARTVLPEQPVSSTATQPPPPQPLPRPQPPQQEVAPSPPAPSTTTTTGPTQAQMPDPPLPLNTTDPELKNLLMSWYWAGYYHGLYEGKKSQQ